jgi:N-hydroxyarylamine O-acetyltransferase
MDIDAYFLRVGYTGPREATLEVLRTLHRLHPAAIPFENLSTLMGRTPVLDIASLEDKMLRAGRGGYCFEQNKLFAAVLESLGFELIPLAARVLWGRDDGTLGPRSHRLAAVRLEGRLYIADVGFGGMVLTAPLRLDTSAPQPTPHELFRVVTRGQGFVLEAEVAHDWRQLYLFELYPQLDLDFEVLNHFVATHPSSFFSKRLLAARALTDRRLGLMDTRLSIHHRDGLTETRELVGVEALRVSLTEDFGIVLPDDSELDTALRRIAAHGQ